MTRCPSCGVDVPVGSRVCASCGVEVTDPGAQTLAIATAESQEHDALLAQLRHELANDYEFEKELGRGGMAVVYKATEVELRRSVAIKVLPPSQARRAMAERFKREARMAASLDHPSIIQIYRVGQAAGTYFFAMKYIEGRALDAIIETQGALPLPVILTVLHAAASALAYAHERGVIHRDIKGGNILVEREGRVLLSDFGIARAPDEKALTVVGSMMGTPYFMSPEACAAGEVGPQSDQYSLGILTFQMITGSVPFDSDSLMGLMQHHYFSPVPDVRHARQGLPEGLVRLLETALAKDPAGRYASTRDMVEAVEAIPRTPAELREGEELLRELAKGSAIPRVRTASLPPVPAPKLMRITSPGEAALPAGRPASGPPRYLRPPLLLGGVLAIVVLSFGAAQLISRGQRRPAATVTPSRRPVPQNPSPTGSQAAPPTHPAAPYVAMQPPAPTGIGRLRVYTLPVYATIAVDGQRAGEGLLADFVVAAGPHRLRITAPEYVTLDTVIHVAAGSRVNLPQITLHRRRS